ncbi:HAD-IA family hydrolase [Candidatus Micrarchaeota archaeon]|nr:HAD-IA family hydrolase [Candidatus Micrarchaeota archaeon]
MKLVKFTSYRLLATFVLFAAFLLSDLAILNSNSQIFIWLAASFVLVNAVVTVLRTHFLNRAIIFDLHGVIAGEGDYWTTRYVNEIPGMRNLIKNLQMKGYKIALLSNNNWEAHQAWERKFGLSTLFDETMVSGEAGVKKPSLAIYPIMLQRLRVAPCNAIFVDDKEENVVAARKAGLHGIVFENIEQLKKDLRALGVSA